MLRGAALGSDMRRSALGSDMRRSARGAAIGRWGCAEGPREFAPGFLSPRPSRCAIAMDVAPRKTSANAVTISFIVGLLKGAHAYCRPNVTLIR
jgi:hypothetical protein